LKLPPLYKAVLLERRKRFLAIVQLENGEIITAHCPNSGSMLGCKEPGSVVLLSRSDNPKRKYAFTWEMILIRDTWVGINTMVPNRLVHEAIAEQAIPELRGYASIRREVPYGRNSRIDLLLEQDRQLCYVEVKNVTLVRDRIASFPDAVTVRGSKHVRELVEMVRQGHRGVMLFLVQRCDADAFAPAADIDPAYADELAHGMEQGVEVLIYQAQVNPDEICVVHRLPWAKEGRNIE
jgi:sugar fermentation stimulation protein A